MQRFARSFLDGGDAMGKSNFGQAYLSGWFCNYICPCGFYFGPDGIKEASIHFQMGHYDKDLPSQFVTQ